MRKQYALTLLVCLFLSAQSFPQEKIPFKLNSQTSPNLKNDISIFAQDGLKIVNAPANFTSTDLIYTGGFLLAAGLSFYADPIVKNTVAENHSSSINNLNAVSEKYGKVLYAGLLGGGLYLTGNLFDNKDISSTGRMIVESVFYTSLVVGVLKYTISRGRPYENDGPGDFFDHTFTEGDVSFPSGHTATAFALSTILSRKIDNPFATIGLYSLAGLTAYERVYDNQHWFSDVFVGAAIGYFIGTIVANSDEERENKNNFLNKVDIMPSLGSNGAGIALQIKF